VAVAGTSSRGDNRVVAWGSNRHQELEVPPGLSEVVSLAAGFNHSLALRSDGSVVAWGSNLDGERDVPSGLRDVVAVYAGDWVSYALRRDGTLAGWGGPRGMDLLPVPAEATDVITVSAGIQHQLALRGDGTIVAWGGNNFAGELDVPAQATNVIEVAGGYGFSMALRADGHVVVWGRRAPDGGSANRQLPPITNVVSLAASWSDAFFLQRDGRVVRWGDPLVQGALPELRNPVAMTASRTSVYILCRDGTVLSSPAFGVERTSVRQEVVGATAVAAHGDHVLALLHDPVVDAPSLTAIRDPDRPGVRFFATRGRTYRVEAAGSLSDSRWDLLAIRHGGDREIEISLPGTSARGEAGYFRVVVY
jgi:hypothetical protein